MPAARDYWLVYRYERQGVPGQPAAVQLAGEISSLLAEARERNLHVVGIQLDIDSPTSLLPRYAEFLSEVRKDLPAGFEISITALLDWFRSGTAINDVIKQVDEFVPQFYDIGDPAVFYKESAIAARIDSAHWGPVFNRFHKRFRIGISSFGRVRLIPNEAPAQTGNRRIAFYGDLQRLDIATNPAFELRAERNRAEETVLKYRAMRKIRDRLHQNRSRRYRPVHRFYTRGDPCGSPQRARNQGQQRRGSLLPLAGRKRKLGNATG